MHDFLVFLDPFVLIFLNVIVLLLCRHVLPRSIATIWAKLLGYVSAFSFVIYSYTHHPCGLLPVVAIRAVLVGLIVYVLVIVVCIAVGFVWWLLVNQPIGIGKAWLHWFGRRLADLWKAHSTAWAWLRRRWRGIWVPKPKTREQILSEAVDDAKRDYKSRLHLIDNAEMDEVESRVARRFARRKLLQRLHRIID